MRLSSEILYSEEKIRQRVEAMSLAIAADTPEGDGLSVIALMDGAFMFCTDLVRRLPMPVHLAFPKVVSVARGGDPTGIELPEEFPVTGADVLVVEDILDTGQTLEALTRALAARRPGRLRLAVLLDKPARRRSAIRADYVGFASPDRWVVGYGLDFEGLYRNLPYISYVEPR
ncbi:MAG: phosphoribosyltransferase family protein [Acidobacteriota bacterium]|nr:phosphoribosyltransferase family protein [Acidobacteriota bacterium]MDH3786187.1 phosphoribosyltransferase family protein [Acidobacteriota bacterium]